MAITFATYAAGTHDTFDVASTRDIYNQLLSPHEQAMPTWKIFLANKQSMELNPNEKFEIPVLVKDYSPAIASKNDTYPTDDIDNITSMEWTVTRMKSGAGTNDIDLAHFSGPKAIFNHINLKVDSMHRGMSNVLGTMPFLNWNQTISASQIDISTALASQALPPEELYLKNITNINQLPYSLPMAARKATTGHTYGNIAVTTSTNAWWVPVVTDATGATVTRNTTAYNASTNPETDVVTAVADPVPLTMDDLDEHLAQMQQNKQYNLLAPVGRKIFRQLRDITMAMNIRQFDSPIADLGIRSTITWNEYNCTFYYEPKMDALWASSIFFWDPECFYLCTDAKFDPTSGTGIYPWARISGTTIWGTMVYMNFQFVCSDRRGVGAMHGYTSES